MMLHDNNRPHKCAECNKTFVQASHLKLHMFQHKNDKPYLCVVCGKSFISKGRLNDHTKIHNGERKVFECKECTVKYFGLHDLKVDNYVYKKDLIPTFNSSFFTTK
jgi:KRAB domain-containing zinc finger protein